MGAAVAFMGMVLFLSRFCFASDEPTHAQHAATFVRNPGGMRQKGDLSLFTSANVGCEKSEVEKKTKRKTYKSCSLFHDTRENEHKEAPALTPGTAHKKHIVAKSSLT